MSELWDLYDRERNKIGQTVERGKKLPRNTYHIAVQVWIKNSCGEWLISRRTPNKKHPLKWEATGGSVIAGEDSFNAALREVKEELGIKLDPLKGRLWMTVRNDFPDWSNPGFLDVWLYEHDCPIESIVLQPEETCDAKWVDNDTLLQMIDSDEIAPFSHKIPPFEV
ncbi:MAG: NUDIX domain-containing protein [Clostridiales bacterium]|nr:NUDIX domain-containing protein [Clostridiales bacterium]